MEKIDDNSFQYDDYVISFSDLTVIEAEGCYYKMDELFKQDYYGSEFWMVETEATIRHDSGAANFKLHLYGDRKMVIKALALSTSEVHYCPDIPLLSSWAQEEGWEMPEPDPDLVRESEDFWKFFYDTSMVYSRVLEKKYGTIDPIGEDFQEIDEE